MPNISELSTSAKPAQKLIAIKDLPIYGNRHSPLESGVFKFVEDEPLPLEKECRALRKKFNEKYSIFAQNFKPIDRVFTSVKRNIQDTDSYLRSDEATILPKAAAISIGGMAGVLLSLRRYGVLRKIIYPTTGLLVIAAFCYPNETIDFVQIGIAHAEQTWQDFKQSPEASK